MFYLIYPNDDTIKFLSPIVSELNYFFGKTFNLIQVDASQASYSEAKQQIGSIPNDAFVLYMGHGTDRVLYGGENDGFEKRPLYDEKNMGFFSNLSLILLSCNSSGLLKCSRTRINNANMLGFGLLPTSMAEISTTRKLRELSLQEEDVTFFNNFLVEAVVNAIKFAAQVELSTERVYLALKLAMNRKINELVLNENNRKRADLIFIIKDGMKCY